MQSDSFAQSVGAPPSPYPTFDGVKSWLDPLSNLIAGLFFVLASLWAYLIAFPAAAAMLAAFLAASVALFSVHQQRNLTRLRETFTTVNNDNWDKDVIEAREVLAKIRLEIASDQHLISSYCEQTEENISKRTTLQTIMNDYENIALGVRMNILDERYLYRWMRSVLIQDWNTLHPLVNAYRAKFKNQRLYIEFEGLAMSWQVNRFYRTGRKAKSALRRFKVD